MCPEHISRAGKCKQGADKTEKEKEGIIYAVPNSPDCPVKHFKKFLDHLHPECSALFQCPKKKYFYCGIWYDKVPVGIHTLTIMMKTMSKLSGLSQCYTKHCICKTCITALVKSDFEAKDIMVVKSVKCYHGERKIHFIPSISEIQSQTWCHCIQYT